MTESPIPALFEKLIETLQPTANEVSRYSGHRRTVQLGLRSAGVREVQPIGSFARGTALRGRSALDLMVQPPAAWIGRGDAASDPATVLGRLRAELAARCPGADLREGRSAVSVAFTRRKYTVDVVPAIFLGTCDQIAHYSIPGPSNRWILACPAAHDRLLVAENERTRARLGRICQLVKHWMRWQRPGVPLHAFAVEMSIATSGVCHGSASYATCVHQALEWLTDHLAAKCEDPLGVSGELRLVDTMADFRRAEAALRASAEQARRAVDAELVGNIRTAMHLWNSVFNGSFPHRVRRSG